ncbi:hypothetical protein HWQ46_20870 [Shewanella sp. D64]|uniref:hypothetical protein n=1 Tax=unclassified Shewanella TaxID=196818 RepID=UPI0022BA5472|nr:MULTISPECIES: hypothetical protein [unclassified Shewanella]MEC4727992.1 hypothetical protein [Shewanella sp. D64]MEC4740163.1 hypothetical protein [Shewanella sp. E94]WBJ95222.1 hypothetical protein HWQ47_26050 [Shewanella sp. MTB7]
MHHLYSHTQAYTKQPLRSSLLIILSNLIIWDNPAMASEKESLFQALNPYYSEPSTNTSDYRNPFSVGYVHRSNWMMLYENLELGGEYRLFEQSRNFLDDSSYIKQQHIGSHLYLGWGAKIGKQLILTSRFSAFLHAGAFKWSREQSSDPTDPLSSNQNNKGTTPYGGIELSYIISNWAIVHVKLEHFVLESGSIDRFGLHLNYQF